ncbi:MAG TPA: hypothetical protein ENG50_04910 [Candidatus Altiarchaeales archaeon]|nr:hypothetical protein [Candidatus Altiarchaeales archaeon]
MSNLIDLEKYFKRRATQLKVAKFLLKRGLRVSEDGKILCNDIEIPYSSIAKVLKVDRRVVKATVDEILSNENLRRIFTNLASIPLFRDVAPELGFGAIEIIPEDPSSKGIIAGVTKIISEAGISVRQIIAEDPSFENAETVIITSKPLPRKLIDDMLKVKGVKKIVVIK